MKLFVLLSAMIAGANAFAVLPANSRLQTSIRGQIDEAEMTANQLEIKSIQDKWTEVRMMSKEESESLEPEWKEAYDRFYEKYESDMVKMTEITEKIQKQIEPPQVAKKTKGQRKRDAWARVQAYEAANK